MKKSVEKSLLGALMMLVMWACSSDDGASARDGSAQGVEAKAYPTYVSTDDLESISERRLLRVLVYASERPTLRGLARLPTKTAYSPRRWARPSGATCSSS